MVRAEVISVVDGDTIRVRLPDGSEEAVRYIGIDAPEEAGAGAPTQPSAAAATAKNADLVAGGVVFLEADASNRDAFNRLLRYVWVEEANLRYTFVNAALVAAGLARVSTVPPDARHADLFAELQEFAQVAGVGLWGDVATPAPTPTPEATDEPDGAPTAP